MNADPDPQSTSLEKINEHAFGHQRVKESMMVWPDDVAALHELCLVDDEGRGEPDDVPVRRLGQKAPVPQAQAHLYTPRAADGHWGDFFGATNCDLTGLRFELSS